VPFQYGSRWAGIAASEMMERAIVFVIVSLSAGMFAAFMAAAYLASNGV